MSLSFTGNAAESATATLTGTIPTIQTHNRLMTCWVDPNDVGTWQILAELDGGSGARIESITLADIAGGGTSGSVHSFFTPNSFSSIWNVFTTGLTTGGWRFVAAYMQANSNGSARTAKAYMNASSNSGTVTGTSSTGTMPAFQISSATAPFNGKIADMAIWHVASVTEADSIVAALYNSGSGKFANAISGVASPTKYWPLLNNGNATVGGNNLSVSVASFDVDHPSLTGAAVQYSLGPASAPYALTGKAANLTARRNITPAAGSFALTGSGVDLTYARKIQAGSAPFTLSGASVDLRRTYVLNAAGAAYTFTGSPADLVYGAVTAYTLDIGSAAYTLAGAANLAVARYLDSGAGSYLLSGAAVNLRVDRILNAAAAAYSLTGSSVDLSTSQPLAYTLEAAGGSFILDGGEARLVWSGAPIPSSKPDGAPGRGRRIVWRGKSYDSIKDRQYLARALSEIVEERSQPSKPEPKRRKRSKPVKFTPVELVELPPVIDVTRELNQKLADRVADLLAEQLANEEEELFLLMAA